MLIDPKRPNRLGLSKFPGRGDAQVRPAADGADHIVTWPILAGPARFKCGARRPADAVEKVFLRAADAATHP